jgi:DNA-binding beta-propeller fold protein YncE
MRLPIEWRERFRSRGRPAGAVADGKGALFVSFADRNAIGRIDTRTRTVAPPWEIAGCRGPAGIAVDAAHDRVYSVCENRLLTELDAANGKMLASAAIEEGSRELAVDPQRGLIFVAGGGGTLTLIKERSPGALSIAQTLKTQAGARSLALDPQTSRVYLGAAQFGLRTGETSEELRFRPTPVPGSFVVLVVGE